MTGPVKRAVGSRRSIAIVAVAALLLASAARGSAAEPQTVRSPLQTSQCSGNLSLRATPMNGTIPLTVYFVATEPAESNRTIFDWDFGDASTLSGVGVAFSDPAHVYLSVGAPVARITTTDPWGHQSCLATIYVEAQPLSVVISEGLTEGNAPLHVGLTAFVVGGTGTYVSVTWNLSDGRSFSGRTVNFTLTQPGPYQIRVSVTDSAGGHAINTANIDVVSAPDAAPPPPYLLWIPVIAIAILGGGAMGALLGRGWSERVERRRAPSGVVEDTASSLGPGAPVEVPVGPSVTGPPIAAPRAAAGTDPTSVAGPGATAGSIRTVPRETPPTTLSHEAIQVSKRILQHLRTVQYLDQPGRAPQGLTQGGILTTLNLSQGAVASALARLVAANLVEVRLDHVAGHPRRLKVYRLTPRGERVRSGLQTDGGLSDPSAHRNRLE